MCITIRFEHIDPSLCKRRVLPIVVSAAVTSVERFSLRNVWRSNTIRSSKHKGLAIDSQMPTVSPGPSRVGGYASSQWFLRHERSLVRK